MLTVKKAEKDTTYAKLGSILVSSSERNVEGEIEAIAKKANLGYKEKGKKRYFIGGGWLTGSIEVIYHGGSEVRFYINNAEKAKKFFEAAEVDYQTYKQTVDEMLGTQLSGQ